MSSLHEPAVDPSTYADANDRIRNGTAWASAPTTDPWKPAILALGTSISGIHQHATLPCACMARCWHKHYRNIR